MVDEQLKAAIKRKDVCEVVMDCMEQVIKRFYEKRKQNSKNIFPKCFHPLQTILVYIEV